MGPVLPFLIQGPVLLWMAFWTAVASAAAAALAWTGEPVYFRTFGGRWLCWFLPTVPVLLWRWLTIADHYRVFK